MHNLFIKGLKEGNREKLLLVPKSDLHNHSTKGCRRAWLEERLNRRFPAPPETFGGLIGMQEWFRATIKPFSNTTEGMVMRWEGAFAEAKRNNIQRLSMNFGAPEIDEMGGMEAFKKVLDGAHARGMKIVMDLVVNHTSDEHEWFQKALQDPDGEYADYYFFRDGKGGKVYPEYP